MQAAILAIGLWWRSVQQPDVRAVDVTLAWVAAELEQTPRVDAPLLMALMWAESRYQSSAGPRCGVLQVWPADLDLPQSACALWSHGVRAGVAAGVVEIETMLADHRVRSLRDALLYRACGNSAFRGACDKGWWVDAALVRAASLRGQRRGDG